MKKINLFITMLTLPFLLFAQTENINIANGNNGFEANFTGWIRTPNWNEGSTLKISTTNPFLGAKALYYPGGNEEQILKTKIKYLDEGQIYTLTFWSAGTEADLYVAANENENEDSTHYAINNNNSGNTYVYHKIVFTATNGNMWLKFHFKANDGGNLYEIYLDELNIVPLIAGGNVGFEDDFTNWTTMKNWVPDPSDIVISTANPYLGYKSAYYPGGDFFQHLIADVSGLWIGKTYTFVFQASGKVSDFYIGPVENVYKGTYHYVNANSGGYVSQKIVFTATATTMRIRFDFYPDEDPFVYDMHVDDFHVFQRAESGKMLINEVNSNPAYGASYLELYNSTDIDLTLLGLQIEIYKDGNVTPAVILTLPDFIMLSNAYLTLTKDNAAFFSVHGFYASLEFPEMDLDAIDGLIITRDGDTDIDHFNNVPEPDSPPNNNHLYLRKGTLLENGGSNLTEHWCDVGLDRKGTPEASNNTSWSASGDGSWSTGSNWSTGYEPCACEDVIIPTAGNPTITITTINNAAARNVVVESGAELIILGKLEIGSDGQ